MTANLRELNAFVILSEELHFGRAALRLGLAQPNLSAMVARLEARAGASLLRRRPRVALTEAGEIVLAGARSVFAEIESTFDRARLIGMGKAGAIRVGFASTAMLGDLPEFFRLYREQNPQVDLKLREMHSASQWDALPRGAIDVAITREVETARDIRAELLIAEPFLAVGPERGMPGSGRQPVRLGDLAQEPFVMCRREVAPALFDQIVECCAAAGFRPRIVQEADEWQTVFGFIRSGFGMTLAPASLSRIGWPGLTFRAITPTPLQAELFCCWDPARASPAVSGFVAGLMGHIGGKVPMGPAKV